MRIRLKIHTFVVLRGLPGTCSLPDLCKIAYANYAELIILIDKGSSLT